MLGNPLRTGRAGSCQAVRGRREEGGGEGAARQQELWESSVFSRKGESDEVKSAGQIYMNCS